MSTPVMVVLFVAVLLLAARLFLRPERRPPIPCDYVERTASAKAVPGDVADRRPSGALTTGRERGEYPESDGA